MSKSSSESSLGVDQPEIVFDPDVADEDLYVKSEDEEVAEKELEEKERMPDGSLKKIAHEMEVMRDVIETLSGENVDPRPTKDEVKRLLLPFRGLSMAVSALCERVHLGKNKKKKDDEVDKKTKKEVEKDHKEKQSAEAFMEEIRVEMEKCHLMSDDLSFEQRCQALATSINKALRGGGIRFDVSNINSFDECQVELQKVFKVVREAKKLLLALRIHQGFLWLRQQEIAIMKFNNKESIPFIINGAQEIASDMAKFKVCQQNFYHAHREDISRSIQLAKISKKFPEIINTEKSWTWFRRALTNDKLENVIKSIQGEDEIKSNE